MQLVYIGLFGALGCVARYLVSGWIYALAGRAFPWGTLAVNIFGSFILGLIMEGTLRSSLIPAQVRIGVTIGFLGGFTTFSTFSYETFRLLEDGSFLQAGANFFLSTLLCLVATAAGIFIARQL